MKRLLLLSAAFAMLWAAPARTAWQQQPAASPADLVSTWTLTSIERNLSSGKPERMMNARGLLIFDAAGHAFEFFTTASRQLPEAPQADPLRAFNSYGGFWGGYQVDAAGSTIRFKAEGAISPNVMGRQFSRTFAQSENRLTLTSQDELHAQGGTRWTWERVPTIDHLSPLYRQVVGFWEHVVEKRVNLTTGAVLSETKRAPSVIVYTPGGFVGVHFPTLTRKPFAADEPTADEARAAVGGYLGYFGALTVYPGQVFHNILVGLSPASGTILRRFAEISGNELTVRLQGGGNQQGQQTATLVMLRRLSGEAEMLPPRR
jgi:hypothetical protein